MALGVSPIQLDVGSLHGDYAASWHRIACVHRQVHNDLFQLTGVGPDGSQIGCQYRAEVDVLADKSTEHRLRVRDDRIHVEHARIEHLLPAEDEELAREPGSSLSGPADQLDALHGLTLEHPLAQQLVFDLRVVARGWR